MLESEIQAPAPHLCIEYLATSNIYTVVTRVAASSYNENIIRETLDLSNTLVENEEGSFLEDQRFATALTAVVNAISTNIILSVETECSMLEVLFGVETTAKYSTHLVQIAKSRRGGCHVWRSTE